MDRITDRLPDGAAYVRSETGKEGTGAFTTQRRLPEIISKLAAYEDTGLEPADIQAVCAIAARVEKYAAALKECRAVFLPCKCCECYHLLNSKNSLGLYFFCGHPNGLKNIRNTETDFCKYAERRAGRDVAESG